MTTQRAVGFQAFGGLEELSVIKRAVPAAGAGEIAVRVAAATVNPTDVLMLAGRHAPLIETSSIPVALLAARTLN